jgi:hypothetical protein
MTGPAPSLTQTADDDAPAGGAPDWARPLVERLLHVLGELAELGLGVARAVECRARAAGPGKDIDLNGLSLAYDRVSRAVRMTIALQSRLIGELVASICRDLGLSPDWPRLAEEAWAKKGIESGVAGSPFGAWMAEPTQTPPSAARRAPQAASP